MQPCDLAAAVLIQTECYAGTLLEDARVFASRLTAFPDLTWVAVDAMGPCAYLFAYRSRLGGVTPLDGDFPSYDRADCLYLHDLAVSPRAAGKGIGPALVAHALVQGTEQKLRYSALVSVQESQKFWSHQGYSAYDRLDGDQAKNLASYQTKAIYMTRQL